MKNLNIKELALWALCIIPIIFYIAVYHMIPEQLPMNWGIDGEVTSYGHKIHLLWIILIPLFINLLMKLLPKIDPKRRNYDSFKEAYYYLRLGLVVYFIFLSVAIFNAISEPANSPVQLIIMLTAALLYFLGVMMPKIKQNYFVGFRLPWTLAEEDTWDKTHFVGGKIFQLTGIILATSALFINNNTTLFIVLISIILISIISVVAYSAKYYYDKPKNKY